jgi:hypothetical protein
VPAREVSGSQLRKDRPPPQDRRCASTTTSVSTEDDGKFIRTEFLATDFHLRSDRGKLGLPALDIGRAVPPLSTEEHIAEERLSIMACGSVSQSNISGRMSDQRVLCITGT